MVRARDVLGPGSPLAARLDGYEDRPGQLEMAEAVEAALSAHRPLFVEAGTGTGKTLAYLVPAILSGRKIVVSTATRALEEQIFAKDLPIVRDILEPLGVPVRAALMKGLANYVCKRRLGELLGSESAERLLTDGDLARLVAWAKTSTSGDRAELAGVAEDAPAWRDVQSSSDTRIGASCKHFAECFVTKMRADAEDAQLVVVNHHLFFADLALRRGRGGDYASVLPPYDAVIFDEAHQIEDIATDFFGVRVSSSRVDALVRDARRGLVAAKLLTSLGTGEAEALLDGVSGASTRFFLSLANKARSGGEPRRVSSDADIGFEVRAGHAALDGALEGLWAYAKSHDQHEALAVVARRARELRGDLKRHPRRKRVATEDGELSAHVAWLDVRDRASPSARAPSSSGPRCAARSSIASPASSARARRSPSARATTATSASRASASARRPKRRSSSSRRRSTSRAARRCTSRAISPSRATRRSSARRSIASSS